MKLLKELATKSVAVNEELSVVKKDYVDAEYTIYVKPDEIHDLTRWQHDLAQRKLKVTVEDGIHQVTGDSAAIVTLMMNQGMPEKEITRRFDDQAGEQFKRDRMYVDFEDDEGKGSRIASRARARAGKPNAGTSNSFLWSMREGYMDQASPETYYVVFKAGDTADNFGDTYKLVSIEKIAERYKVAVDTSNAAKIVAYGSSEALEKFVDELHLDADAQVYGDDPRENFLKDRGGKDFEDSDESSDYSDRRRNRLHRHKERMRPAFGIKGVSEETIKESGKRSGFLTTFDVDSFDMTNFREEDLIAILENSGYTDNTDIVGAEFVKVGNKNFIYKIQFTDSDGGVDSGNIFISVDQTGKLKAEF